MGANESVDTFPVNGYLFVKILDDVEGCLMCSAFFRHLYVPKLFTYERTGFFELNCKVTFTLFSLNVEYSN